MAKSATKVAKPSKADSKAVKAQVPKTKAKDVKNVEKKKKIVEPESESEDSDDDSEEEASASDSDSDSDSDASEEEAPKKANGKKAKAEESDSDDSDSDSDEESEEEKAAPKANGKKAEASDSDSDSDSDEESEEEAPKANGTKKDDSDDSDDSDSDSDEEEETKTEAPSKKRKAEEDIDAAPKKAKADDNAPTTLFAGSLSWGVNDDSLYESFKSFDGLVSARVVTDKNTGRSRGFGYVDFDSAENATKAYDAMQGKEIDGRALNLDYANAKPAEANPRDRANDRAQRHGDVRSEESDTLFVGNLPFDTEQDAVRAFFSEIAEVASVRLPTRPHSESGNLKGFGYVTFNSVADAKSALEAKNGESIGNGRMSRAVRLDFAGSRPPQSGGGGGFGGRGGGRGGRGGGRGGPRGGGRGGFGGRGGGGGRGGFGGRGGYSGTKVNFD